MSDDPDDLSPVERRIYGLDRSPPPPHLDALGRDMVERTKLTFKLFRRDFEAVGSVASAAFVAGEITRQDASDLFVDLGHAISLPLTERYLAQGACARLADWLRARPSFADLDWLAPRNRMAIEGLVAQGEAALAVQLLRQHLHKAMAAARARWRYAGAALKAIAAGKPVPPDAQDMAERIPADMDLMLLEIAECEPWITAHGAPSDAQALADMREDIARARRRISG
jgi:hypothetical protein